MAGVVDADLVADVGHPDCLERAGRGRHPDHRRHVQHACAAGIAQRLIQVDAPPVGRSSDEPVRRRARHELAGGTRSPGLGSGADDANDAISVAAGVAAGTVSAGTVAEGVDVPVGVGVAASMVGDGTEVHEVAVSTRQNDSTRAGEPTTTPRLFMCRRAWCVLHSATSVEKTCTPRLHDKVAASQCVRPMSCGRGRSWLQVDLERGGRIDDRAVFG